MKPVDLTTARREIEISRDQHGVPHITAPSWLDALYGLGYMHGLDRGTQLLFSRTIASGKGAEEISDTPELLETDRFFRRMGLHLGLAAEIQTLDEGLFHQLTAYSDGVNDGLAGLGRSWPMWATGYRVQPWLQESILLVGRLLSFGGLAVSQMQNERLLIELIHAGVDGAALRELMAPRLEGVDFELIRNIRMANQLSDAALELLTDLPRLAGSNAWAVAPCRSASGHALLASDPHLEVNRLPALWYEAVLRCGEQYVLGATLPGCPLFGVGRTNHVAWGVTYLKGDTIDYFIEDCRPGGATGWQYRRRQDWHDFRRRDELIDRRGAGREILPVYENDQGVLDGDPETVGAGLQLSLAWTGTAPGFGRALGTWLELLQCRSTPQAMDVVRECDQPTLSWVFADREGHIGLQGSGLFPRRGNGQLGLAPIPAWEPANHWQGWLPKSVLPRVLDPSSGFVATANEDLNPPGSFLLITQPVHDYRVRRARELLQELPQATLADMQRMQHDVVSLQARELRPLFLAHLPAGELRERLENWDCRYAPDSREATLFLNLYRNVLIELMAHEQGIGWRRFMYLCTRVGFSTMILTAADRLLGRDESLWWSGRSKGDLIRRAASRIKIESLRPWSDVNHFHFADRFFGNRRVGRILGFASRQYPMPGNHATLFQGHVLQTATREFTFAPCYHFVTDLGTDAAETNLPGGPSENRFSKLYWSDVPNWLAGKYKRLQAPGDTPQE